MTTIFDFELISNKSFDESEDDKSTVKLEDNYEYTLFSNGFPNDDVDDSACFDQTCMLQTLIVENMRLRKRTRVLSSLCGFETSLYVHKAASLIQNWMKKYLTKKRFQTVYKPVFSRIRTYARSIRERDRRKSATLIQSYIRGRNVRNTNIGRALGRIFQLQKSTEDLEILVLKLTSMYHGSCL